MPTKWIAYPPFALTIKDKQLTAGANWLFDPAVNLRATGLGDDGYRAEEVFNSSGSRSRGSFFPPIGSMSAWPSSTSMPSMRTLTYHVKVLIACDRIGTRGGRRPRR